MSLKIQKTILLGMPTAFGLYEAIIKNLEFHGFKVISICIDDGDFTYKNIWERLFNTFQKKVLNNQNYKEELRFNFRQNQVKKILKKIDSVDYTLLIRADVYHIETIKKIKLISKKTIGYQWDGLHRFSKILNVMDIFDKFYIFDPKDIDYKKNPVFPTTNFYYDFDTLEKDIDNEFDIFFLGSYMPERIETIKNIISLGKKMNLKIKIIFISDKKITHKKHGNIITYTRNITPYLETLKKVKKSKILLDLLNETHKGLSFRSFESIRYEKKLITNNTTIQFYDFYNPKNIFILGVNDESDLENFIRTPYIPINNDIKLKYSFSNWIKYVLDIEPHKKIELPKF